jgi:hypothetical protein
VLAETLHVPYRLKLASRAAEALQIAARQPGNQ